MLGRLFQKSPRSDPLQLEAYASAVRPLFSRVSALYEAWFERFSLEARDEDLANLAAINRWETAGLLEAARLLDPPKGLERAHGILLRVLERSARGSHLLSSGYRFNSSRARCDGQALLLEGAERLLHCQKLLEQCGVSVAPGEPAAALSAE